METIDLLQYVSPHKKRKLNNEDQSHDYLPGSIMRIKLRNFMSYSLSEFQMAPNLNMIIGPNGTGKSTIVCAICIGLAGKMEYLGKPTMQFSHFVKQGQSTAIIEIELKGKEDGERILIRREIDAHSSKSTWKLNNRDSNERQVKQLVHSLDIQLGSLCQFLAQDRVSKFAGQKPSELLKEIERSFSNGELLKQHEKIIELFEGLTKAEKEKGDIESRLINLTKERESLLLEVEKFKRYQEKKQDLQLHKKLIPFVKIQDAKVKFSEAKVERDRKIRLYKSFEEQIKPLSNLINQFADGASSLGDEINKLEQKESDLETKVQQYTEKCETYDSDISNLEEQLRRKLTEIVKKSRKLEQLQIDLKEWERNKADFKDALAPEDSLHERVEERSRLQNLLNELRDEMETHKRRMRLLKDREVKFDAQINDMKRQLHTKDRLNVLSGFDEYSQNSKTLKAVQFLRNQKDKFEGRLFEPAVVSLSVQKGYGTILSNVVSLDSQLAIVTTSQENHNYVTRAILDKLKLNVSFRQISSNFNMDQTECLSRQELKLFGFEGYLTDFIDGPKQVIQMLCEQHMIHLIPVSIRPLDLKQLESVQNDGRIKTFVSGDQILRTFNSVYGNKRGYSTATFLNYKYRLFESNGLSEDAKQKIENNMKLETERQKAIVDEVEEEKAQYESKKQDYNELESQYQIVNDEVKKAHERRNRYMKLESKCDQISKDIDTISSEIEQLNNENQSDIKVETNTKIRNLVVSKLKLISKLAHLLIDLDQVKADIVFRKVAKLQQDNRRVSIQAIGSDAESKRLSLAEDVEKLRAHVKELKTQTSREIKELNDAVNRDLTLEERDLLATLAKTYMEAGEFDEPQMQLKIETIRRELNNFSDAEESSIVKYSRVETSIRDFEQRLPEYQTMLHMYNKQIEEIKQTWLPNLQKLVSSISQNFNKNFTKVYPLGEVRLHQDPQSYADWRLEILVQFRRDEELTVLDGTTQSGGEKSVSTAIFLNSLQGLTNTPFRVVDEINQGMDARNERLVHKLIVESACLSDNTSQYFLITPKLLTDLLYHEKMSVHCIMAGKFCPDPLIDENFLKFGIASNYI